jgi:hypothetical protein
MGLGCIILNLLYTYFVGEIGIIITTMKTGLAIGSIFSAEEFGKIPFVIVAIM